MRTLSQRVGRKNITVCVVVIGCGLGCREDVANRKLVIAADPLPRLTPQTEPAIVLDDDYRPTAAEAQEAILEFLDSSKHARGVNWVQGSRSFVEESDGIIKGHDDIFIWGPWSVDPGKHGASLFPFRPPADFAWSLTASIVRVDGRPRLRNVSVTEIRGLRDAKE